MKCDPRIIELECVEIHGANVEDGNHLRTFVGAEHGFYDDKLTVYRRPAQGKHTRLRSIVALLPGDCHA